MKPENIMDAINEIDYDMVEAAEESPKASGWSRSKWIAAAACAVLVIGFGAFFLYKPHAPKDPVLPESSTGNRSAEGRYRVAVSGESALIWPWEYMTPTERYTGMTLGGIPYCTRAREIREELLGEALGECESSGYDVYTETSHPAAFAVRAIRGADPEELVAVSLEGTWVVFRRDDKRFPANLGALMDACSLPDTLPLERFCTQTESETTGWYLTDAGNEIWALLSECRDAACVVEDNWNEQRVRITFTITSEPLGVYAKGLSITADGYLVTNLMEYRYIFKIGTETADRIIRLAKEHGSETEPQPYYEQVAGVLTEIGDGYVLIDDTVLCRNEAEGLVYKVLTDDLRIRRCLEFPGNIDLGDLVVVEYEGRLDPVHGNTVTGAFSMSEAILIEEGAVVPE